MNRRGLLFGAFACALLPSMPLLGAVRGLPRAITFSQAQWIENPYEFGMLYRVLGSDGLHAGACACQASYAGYRSLEVRALVEEDAKVALRLFLSGKYRALAA